VSHVTWLRRPTSPKPSPTGASPAFIKGYGVRELGKPDPVTVHTRFGNMSTTKAFTALLIGADGSVAQLRVVDGEPIYRRVK